MPADPTIATSTGDSPARIAGITKNSSTAKVTPSPASAVTPRHLPKATSASRKAAPTTHRPTVRWWSTMVNTTPSGLSLRIRTTASPSSTSGAPVPLGRGTTIGSSPAGASASRTCADPQPLTSSGSCSGQASRATPTTVPSTSAAESPSTGGLLEGHSSAMATTMSRPAGTRTMRARRRSGPWRGVVRRRPGDPMRRLSTSVIRRSGGSVVQSFRWFSRSGPS